MSKYRRRNPAEVIRGHFMSADERDCVMGLKDLLAEQGLKWTEDDQVIAVHQWCPLDAHVHGLIADFQDGRVDRDSAIIGLSESMFRIGLLNGIIASEEAFNEGFWRAMSEDLVRYIAETIADMKMV